MEDIISILIIIVNNQLECLYKSLSCPHNLVYKCMYNKLYSSAPKSKMDCYTLPTLIKQPITTNSQ